MAWIPAGGGYEVTLTDGKVQARNAAGKRLRAVPAALKNDEAVVRLRQLATWLQRHHREVGAQVEAWMIRSLPVPLPLLRAVWPDETWRSWLTDLVVRDGDDPARTGLLKTVTDRGAGVIDLDGESTFLDAGTLQLPHPVLLGDELDELREFAVELGVHQQLPQLLRETWTVGNRDPDAQSVRDFSGGRYDQLRYLTARAGSLGYQVRGGFAVCRLWEQGRPLEAVVWVGADEPSMEAETGDLSWTVDGGTLPLSDVGPVAFSEGMRMAAGLWAGRKPDESDESDEPAADAAEAAA